MPFRPSPPPGRLALFVALIALALTGCSRTAPKPEPLVEYEALPLRDVPDYLNGTILQQVDLANTAALRVQGYGVVVNLDYTGDSTAPLAVRQFIFDEMIRTGFGSANGAYPGVSPEDVLQDPRVAIVRVDGYIPAGAKPGDRFDLQVSALQNNDTTSLAGGTLWMTTLRDANRVTQFNPGENVNVLARGRGAVFVNPAYAAQGAPEGSTAKASLRTGLVLNGGRVEVGRALALKLRQPRNATARFVENRIQRHFQDKRVAAAQDEAIVYTYLPETWPGDLDDFANLILHLYGSANEGFAAEQARVLAEAALLPEAPLANITYAWQGLGTPALPAVVPLIDSSDPDVSYAAARAAAAIGDVAAQEALADLAADPRHPHQLEAVQALAAQPDTPAVRRLLRDLTAAASPLVRIEAHVALADRGDAAVFREAIDDKFWLEIGPEDGPPLVYASTRGEPRIAVLGRRSRLRQPLTFATLGNELTFSTSAGPDAAGDRDRPIDIYWRGPAGRRAVKLESGTDLAQIVARLGGKATRGGPRLDLGYAEIVAVLTDLEDAGHLGDPAGRDAVALYLQETPILEDVIRRAEPIPDARTLPRPDAGPVSMETEAQLP